MATMKRRVIYTSDEEWEAYRTEAHATSRTVSDFIRSHLAGYVRTTDPRAVTKNGEPQPTAVRIGDRVAFVGPAPVARYDVRPIRPVPKTKGR
jgi:hypothetical protein